MWFLCKILLFFVGFVFGFCANFPKICEIFRSGMLKNAPKTVFLGQKSVKKPGKRNFILLIINMLQRKCRKSKKSLQGCWSEYKKIYFCNPKRQRYGTARERGLSTGRCSLKEWKNVANTQEEEFEIRKRWGQDRHKKEKTLIIMESSILAQDERWRQA